MFNHMGIFSTLLNAIFSHATPAASTSTTAATSPPPVASPAAPTPVTPASSAAPTLANPVDVGAILDGLAAKNPEKLDWKHSIVDLMKLVGADSSLSARKELAKELNYAGDMSDSATMNVWLHKAVLEKIAQNGGKIPAGL